MPSSEVACYACIMLLASICNIALFGVGYECYDANSWTTTHPNNKNFMWVHFGFCGLLLLFISFGMFFKAYKFD